MDAKELAYQLREMIYLFGKNGALRPPCQPKIRHHDMMFLTAISKLDQNRGGVKMSDLSNYFNISAPAISQTIRRFEKLGYIERIQLQNDRRSVYIRIQPDVLAMMDEVESVVNENLMQLITYLGEEDAKELIRIMKKASEFRETN